MKINYNTTALWLLDRPDKIEFDVPEAHVPMTKEEKIQFGQSIQRGFADAREMFKKNIRFVSSPFMQAYFKGKHKLKNVFDKEPMEESGTFIWKSGSFTFTNFYYLKTYGAGDDWKADFMYLQFSKHTQNEYQHLDVCVTENDKGRKTFIWDDHYKNGCDHTYYFSFLITFLCFIKYVELETKLVAPGKREKHAGIKYVNETKHKIEVLDSTWFTSIVRSEGFSVGADTGGFWRMQPWGPGLSQRKLMWILPFEKEGYTRKAKILAQ